VPFRPTQGRPCYAATAFSRGGGSPAPDCSLTSVEVGPVGLLIRYAVCLCALEVPTNTHDALCTTAASASTIRLVVRSVARFYIENFGCRATQADGAALERQFLERGLERARARAMLRLSPEYLHRDEVPIRSSRVDTAVTARQSGLPHSGNRLLCKRAPQELAAAGRDVGGG